MDPRDWVIYHGWILYKDGEEGEKDISVFLVNLRTRLRRDDIVGDWEPKGSQPWSLMGWLGGESSPTLYCGM